MLDNTRLADALKDHPRIDEMPEWVVTLVGGILTHCDRLMCGNDLNGTLWNLDTLIAVGARRHHSPRKG